MSTLTDALAQLAARLPAEALPYAVKIVEGALASDDATEYLARRAQADAAHAAAQATVAKLLEEGR